jgi:hypothetical protein
MSRTGDRDMSVMQPTRFGLVINLEIPPTQLSSLTSRPRNLGLEVPPALLALADEVIE